MTIVFWSVLYLRMFHLCNFFVSSIPQPPAEVAWAAFLSSVRVAIYPRLREPICKCSVCAVYFVCFPFSDRDFFVSQSGYFFFVIIWSSLETWCRGSWLETTICPSSGQPTSSRGPPWSSQLSSLLPISMHSTALSPRSRRRIRSSSACWPPFWSTRSTRLRSGAPPSMSASKLFLGLLGFALPSRLARCLLRFSFLEICFSILVCFCFMQHTYSCLVCLFRFSWLLLSDASPQGGTAQPIRASTTHWWSSFRASPPTCTCCRCTLPISRCLSQVSFCLYSFLISSSVLLFLFKFLESQ